MGLFNKSGRGPAEMPFLDHLEELRWRILWSMLALLVGCIVGYFIVTRLHVLEWLMKPVVPYLEDGKLAVLGPLDAFMLTLKLTITVGFILAFPVISAQIWAFVSPALHKREKRAIVPALYGGMLLFAAGVALAYYVVLPMTLKFGQSFQTASLKTLFVAGPYLALVTKILIAFGAVFELPVVVLVLAAFGLVSSKFLAEKRRFAIAISAVAAALLTPGDAITVTVFMTGPLILLYELSIGLTRLVERRRARAALQPPLAEAS
jgi:sec-independent protein translocase protein TatC